jgi:hypothetical protein
LAQAPFTDKATAVVSGFLFAVQDHLLPTSLSASRTAQATGTEVGFWLPEVLDNEHHAGHRARDGDAIEAVNLTIPR